MKNESIINLYKEKDLFLYESKEKFVRNFYMKRISEILLSPLLLLYRDISRDSCHMTRVFAKCNSGDNVTYLFHVKIHVY